MKQLVLIDYLIIAAYIIASFTIGNYYHRRAKGSLNEYFLSGRRMPWWLIGLSMVATNYAIDYPLTITGLVAKKGVMGTWYVWSLAIAGIAATFFFSRLWRRAHVVTDAELIKYRYSGRIGNGLRIFKGIYFGVLINCFVLGWIFKALIKVGTVMTGWQTESGQWCILGFFVLVTMIYTMTGGLSAVIVTDCVQFGIIVVSAIVLAFFAVAKVGGIQQMVSGINQLHPGQHYLDYCPSLDGKAVMPWSAFLVYILLQWWAHKYADGGGKLIQRMSAARNENHSLAGTFLYSVLYVLTTWPIILTALCAMVLFPKFEDPEKLYPALMTQILPNGLLGLCVIGLLSAFMSTVSTHFNLGASYIINDIYKAFFVKGASERHYVVASKVATVLVAASGMVLSYFITSIADMWQFVLSFASGAGVVWILRWFWWRINAWSELSAMIVSAAVSSYLFYLKIPVSGAHPLAGLMMPVDANFMKVPATTMLFLTVVCTIPAFLLVTFLTAPVADETLRDFYQRVQPGRWGWRRIAEKYGIARNLFLGGAFLNFLLGTTLLLCINFGVGTLLLRSAREGALELLCGGLVAVILIRRIRAENAKTAEPEKTTPLSTADEKVVRSV